MSSPSSDRFPNLLQRWRKEPLIPSLLLVLAGSLWGFIEISQSVNGQETHALDRSLLLAIRDPANPEIPIGPHWLRETARDLTALGGFTILTLLTLASAGVALFLKKPRIAAVILVAIVSGMGVMNGLKRFFDRARPDVVPHAVEVTNASFPSGHTTMSAIVYLTLGVLLARTQQGLAFRVYLVSLSVIIAVLVGISRVYLGVHWPSDVLAGWTLGAAWALLFWMIALKVDPRSTKNGDR